MEITRCEAIPLASAVEGVEMAFGGGDREVGVQPVLVKVHTDTEHVGLGETLTYDASGAEGEAVARMVEALGTDLEGRDPRDPTAAWESLYVDVKRSNAWKALSALDEALWDLTGKSAGEPLYRLLGGEAGEVRAYATFPRRQSADALVDSGAWLADSFESMKITVGADVERDRERIRAVAEGLPDRLGLSVDANTSYTVSEALRVGRAGEEVALEWFEEPIPHTDIEGQAELNRRLDVPIAAYQSHAPHYPAVEHLRAGALEVYQPSAYLCGGVTGTRRVAELTDAFGKRLVPHAFGPLVNYAATLHVAAASPACDLIEFAVYDDSVGDPGEYVASPYVAGDPVRVEDGVVSPPEEPGIGVELDESEIERLRLD
jgi:L-alanine-DL-glutamate epimerase-like enolase superfamily enzyme